MLRVNPSLAVYIHWPFCTKKCPYCDFNSHVRDRVDSAAFAAAYSKELSYYRFLTGPRHVTSVFFGGGTPSLMPPEIVRSIIEKINDLWGLEDDIEITLEANPGSSEIEKFKSFKQNGINRLSVGLQSLYEDQLRFLGRIHTAEEGRRAIAAAQDVFDRYSFDLIYARPGQTAAMWEDELSQALPLARGHMSLYQLTIEEKTAFYGLFQRGEFDLPDEDSAADLYTLTDQIMAAAGMPAYEVSNYASAGHESAHNLTYWRYGDYVGVGPGAHGRIMADGVKWASAAEKGPEKWLACVAEKGYGAPALSVIPCADRAAEALMMGLRLTEGVPYARLMAEGGGAEILNRAHLAELMNSGDLVCGPDADRMIATPQGRLRLNQVLSHLLCTSNK